MITRLVSALALAFVGFGFSTLATAQMDHSTMHGTPVVMPTPKTADANMAEGQVKKVDKVKGTVTLAHGALNGMPPMTMAYKVKDTAWLDKLQSGQKIRFAIDPADGGMTLNKIELIK